MISRPELQQHFADSREVRGDGFKPEFARHHWRSQPTLAALHDALDALDAPTAEQIRTLIEAAFADTAWVDLWIAAMARSALGSRYFQPPLAPTSNAFQRGIAVFAHPLVSVSLNILPLDVLAAKKMRRVGPAAVIFTGSVSVQKFLRAGGALLRMWEAEASSDTFSLADGHACRPAGHHPLVDGEIFTLDGRTQSYVIEHAVGDIVLLQAEIHADRAPLLVEYDAETCVAVAAGSTNDLASRSQMLISFLAAHGRQGDEAAIEPFTHDASFFLRWHATAELLRMNQARARARLHEMAHEDPHPDLREAARSTLEMLGQAATQGSRLCHA
jgi:hypothetical protein